MKAYFEGKSANLDLIERTIGKHSLREGNPPLVAEDGSFDGKPLLLWLESTARCNLRCEKCGHAFEPPGTPRILPRNLADAVVDEADEYFTAAVKVRVSGYGEMFLYARLRSLVQRLKRYGCWVEGTTNGVIIDRSEIDWVVELGWDQLVFSIDGVEPETMQRLRGADLNKIWDVLRYLKRRKEELNSTKPRIVIGFVAQSDNLHELPGLVRKLSELNICFLVVNTLHYKKYVPGTDDPYGKLYHDYSLARLDRKKVEELIEEGRTLAKRANIGYGVYIDLDRVYQEAAEDAADELVTIFTKNEPTPQPREPLKPFYCVYPWTSLLVTARGSTSVCCSMRGEVGTVLNSGDLDRVWNGETLRAIRKSIARGEVHPSCAYCVSRNRHLSSFVELDEARAALAAVRPQEAPAVSVQVPVAEVPDLPIFGYIDTRELCGRSRDRVRIEGWVASSRNGAPVRELRLHLQGQRLGTIRDFHARPDVAAYFGRNNLLHSGWRAQINLPALRPGRYELVVEATDLEGASGRLEPLPVQITE